MSRNTELCKRNALASEYSLCARQTFRKIQMEESFVGEFKVSKEVGIMWLSLFESLIMFYNGMSKHWIVTWKLFTWKLSLQTLGPQLAVPAFLATRCVCTMSIFAKTQTSFLQLEHPSQHAQQAYVDRTEQGWEARAWPSNLWLKPWESKQRTKEHKDTWNSINKKHCPHYSYLRLSWVGANPINTHC